MYRLVIMVFLFTSYKADAARDTLNFKTADAATYNYYMEQKWDSVIKVGSSAIKQGIDYYYLRMRMGLSYYAEKKYRTAEQHFQKALKFNSFDDVAKDYLYNCYLYCEQYDLAGKLSCSFSDSLTTALHTRHHKPIDVIYVDAGEKFSNDTSVVHNAYFFQVEAANRISRSISFFESYTFYSQTAYWGKIFQNDLYVKCDIPLPHQWVVSPAVHFLLVNSQPYYFNSFQFVSSLQCQKSINYFDIGASLSYSDIAFQTQLQQNLSATFYPFDNSKLFLKATLSLMEDSSKNLKSAIEGWINVKPVSKLTLSLGAYKGNAVYINQSDAYLVNNGIFLTSSKFTFNVDVSVNRHFIVYALYQYENTSDTFDNKGFSYNTVLIGSKIYL